MKRVCLFLSCKKKFQNLNRYFLGEGQVKVKPEEKSILILSQERANSSEIEDGNSFKASKTLGTSRV